MPPSSRTSRPAIVWFRDDLRLSDHPALHDAAQTGRPLLCVYVLDDKTPPLGPLGGASRWWLHGALAHLKKNLAGHGGSLLVLRGPSKDTIMALASVTHAASIHWHTRLHENERAQDAQIAKALGTESIDVREFCGTTLLPPETVRTKEGGFYRVFGSFWKAFRQHDVPEPLDVPQGMTFHPDTETLLPESHLNEAGLLPTKPDWAAGLRKTWEPGEAEAQEHLQDFVAHAMSHYATGRNLVAREGTSRLSPYLAFGEISPRQIWATITSKGSHGEGSETFLAEIGWREFAKYSLFHMPQMPTRNLSPKFDALKWRNSDTDLKAWQQGQTGVPIVDAAMRQLWQTGWMHNRARMIVGSFLTKHLLIDWRKGEEWFRDTLVDADWASNTTNWQWVAGTGIEAAPFFRVFNPTLQAQKFDQDGDYIRQWVPELKKLDGKALFEPWNAPEDILDRAGVTLGKTYPYPLVDLKEGRERALAAFRAL